MRSSTQLSNLAKLTKCLYFKNTRPKILCDLVQRMLDLLEVHLNFLLDENMPDKGYSSLGQ